MRWYHASFSRGEDRKESAPQLCPWCSSHRFVRNGVKANGLQNYKCSACERQFTPRSGSFWAGMRYPQQIILGCVALKFIGRASYQACLTLLEVLRGAHVGSTNTAWQWVQKCETAFETVHRSYRKSYGRLSWRVDEIFCRCRGSTSKRGHAYIIVVSDNKSNILAIEVSTKRDTHAVERTLAKIVDEEARDPKFFVSDKWKPYRETIGFNFPNTTNVATGIRGKTVHRKRKRYRFTINPHERLNGTIQSWLRPMKGFKSLESANRMMNMYRICHTTKRQMGHVEFFGRLASLP